MSDSPSAGPVRRFLSRLKAGALLITAVGTAQAQAPAPGDFDTRAERLRERVATLEADGTATAADALRELGADPAGLGYWCNWSNCWGKWSKWPNWGNWGNWPNWCNW